MLPFCTNTSLPTYLPYCKIHKGPKISSCRLVQVDSGSGATSIATAHFPVIAPDHHYLAQRLLQHK